MSSRLTATLLFATACLGQDVAPIRYPFADLVLSTPSAVNSSTSCNDYLQGPPAIMVRIYSEYSPKTCYNLATIFSDQDGAELEATDEGFATCNPADRNIDCGNDYFAFTYDEYSSTADYSQTRFSLYRSGLIGAPEEPDFNDSTMKVFAGEDCG
ncbi:hypothetical protein Slin15195_G096070 [Septoria linicola]|uniref:Uncharacterized protein n=1 Tax=Septoria linicola TaxID=215465 RepID=A0A9Q9AZW0_9PEZI|nr:hypothetical protein Slin14017_G059160 [Septoria linicola]USW56288.1 hypothetical protein Slin15195_G096070 [Septoria linicola]